jgi:hypothetical protein
VVGQTRPARTRRERAAATAARKRAIAGNWCAAAALDDDQLDIPGYRPRYGWKPATGTGPAPDIHLAPPPPKEPPMTGDYRNTADFIHDILDALERHGHARSDDLHAGHAIGLTGDLAHIYQGTQDAPPGGYVVVTSSQPAAPAGQVRVPGAGRRQQPAPDRGAGRVGLLQDPQPPGFLGVGEVPAAASERIRACRRSSSSAGPAGIAAVHMALVSPPGRGPIS